jgi:hypothetical protein
MRVPRERKRKDPAGVAADLSALRAGIGPTILCNEGRAMINEDPGLVAGVRQAIGDLTATVSDFEGDSVGLAAERWSSYIDRVVERGAAGGAELGLLLNGYRQLALKLVVELARAKDVSPQGVMRGVGKWTALID